jgi:hypothetical protein
MAKGIALRKWRISRSDYQDDYQFREAVQGELASFEHIGERLGVALVAAPIRERALQGGDWFTVAWAFQTATVPAATAATEVDVEAEPEIDAADVAWTATGVGAEAE